MQISKDAYQTIKEDSDGEFKDRGSKFIAYLFPIISESEFATRLEEVKNEHFKARHHCPAFRLRTGLERSSDDGEPSGSAGKPMMNQLYSAELVDVGCVCVRYFGGTKLGVSGLINAYKTAVAVAIENAKIITRYETVELILRFDYAIMGTLMDCVKQLDLNISSKRFEEKPELVLRVNRSEVEDTILRIKARMLGRSIEDVTEETDVEGIEFER